ncbi:HPF/RaiA family ribosome-associated protein [Desulfohalovibrio reitneri]|uniref:HPF/RaiA family ribosome-associated protein n=1 Tax=Desulfohalovibrio reitneri TaxID=1307759 RepID=UPI0009DC96F1|nr:HPF/RaiA family ribosome-associated protein [Desulfohalovibrio reitneri]
MQIPLEITFRNMETDWTTENLIREKVAKLEKVAPHMIGCRVAVEKDNASHDRGSPYRVRLDITVPPRKEVAVTRETTQGHLHEDLTQVVRDAFEAARKQLKKITEKQQKKVKSHPQQEVNGIVVRLFPEEDYGFIKTPQGQEVYFHRNAVAEDEYDRIVEGTGVNFTATMGTQGLQATTVSIEEKLGGGGPEGEPPDEATPTEGWQRT